MKDKPSDRRDYFLSDITYDYLRLLARLVFPGLAIVYFIMADTIGMPDTPAVLRTLLVMEFIIGAILQYATWTYNKSDCRFDGTIDVIYNAIDEKKIFTLNLDRDPIELEDQTIVCFKVISPAIS